MNEPKINEELKLKVDAYRLLRSPHFFRHVLDATQALGLVGEEKNALVVYLIGTSRLLAKPVSLFVKGASGSGKNFLARNVLKLFAKECITEITSSSGTSWNYMGRQLQHQIVYIQEENKATGNVHPARLLISENEITRMVAVRKKGGKFVTQKQVTKGPVACISTTTKNRLAIDDETRHLSVWVDDSAEQTKKIIAAHLIGKAASKEIELEVWHEVQNLLSERAKLQIEFGAWGSHLIDQVWTGNVRVRRYFEAFREICKTVCLIRSFLRDHEEVEERGRLVVTFVDFAIASLIFDDSLSQSLSYSDDDDRELVKTIIQISERKEGRGASAQELEQEMGISADRAYDRLRKAVERGSICRVNEPERGNKKLYLPAKKTRMLPGPDELFRKMEPQRRAVRFTHPVSGEQVEYRNRGGR